MPLTQSSNMSVKTNIKSDIIDECKHQSPTSATKRAPSTVRRAIPPRPSHKATSSVLSTITQRSNSASKSHAEAEQQDEIDESRWSNEVPRSRLAAHSISRSRSDSISNVHAAPVSVSVSTGGYTAQAQNPLTPSAVTSPAVSHAAISVRKPISQLTETKPLNVSLFVNDVPSDYVCTLCDGVVKAPYDIQCGHLFCRTCMLKHVNAGHKKCPMASCQAALPPVPQRGQVSQWKLNNAIRKIVAKMEMKCREHAAGCTAVYAVGIDECNDREHEQLCEYAQIRCEQCNEYCKRSAMSDHVANECNERTQRCERCLDMIKMKDYSQHTSTDLHCANMSYCPNRCTDADGNVTVIVQSKLEQHRTLCTQQPTRCQICDLMLPLSEMNNHLNNSAAQHLNALYNRFTAHTQSDVYATLVDEIRSLRVENEELRSFVTEHKQTVNRQLKMLREYQTDHSDAQYQDLLHNKSLISELQHKQQYVLEYTCANISKMQGGKRSVSQQFEYQINDHTYLLTLFVQVDNGVADQRKYTFCVNVVRGALPLPLSITIQFKHAIDHKAVHVPSISNKTLNYTFTKLGSGYGMPVTLAQLKKCQAYRPERDEVTYSVVFSPAPQLAAWRNNVACDYKPNVMADANIQTDTIFGVSQ